MQDPLPLAAVFAGLAVLIGASPATAQVHKWTDERGVVQYSSKPPADGRKTTVVDTAPAAAGASPDAAREARRQAQREKKELRQMQKERAKREREQDSELAARQRSVQSSQSQARNAEAARLAREKCLAERRTDCDQAGTGAASQPSVVRRAVPQPVNRAAPFPVPSQTQAQDAQSPAAVRIP